MLNISYNTTRLGKIISDYQEKVDFVASRKAFNKGRAASDDEVQFCVLEYLKGTNVSTIASSLYRSPGFVKAIIERVGVPQRGEELINGVDILPEQCLSDSFDEGELAWSARYHTLVRVQKELSIEMQSERKGMKVMDYEAVYGCKAYQIYILESVDSDESFFPGVHSGGFNAYALAYDLGSLKHLKALGINLEKAA